MKEIAHIPLASDTDYRTEMMHSDQRLIRLYNDLLNHNFRFSLLFTVIFIFLYAVLGASLTLDPALFTHRSTRIYLAIQAVPVLIAFSGYVIALLFVFLTRSQASQITQIQQRLQQPQPSTPPLLIAGPYSQSGVMINLALFIAITWVILYNYLTFTTSGVIGSVISLFISTMIYVILDIQLMQSIQLSETSDSAVNAPTVGKEQ